MTHTLLYKLYSLAREDEDNVKLLEDCNKVFKNPKKNTQKTHSKTSKDDDLPDFADAFLAIAAQLKLRVVVALDKVHTLSPDDQQGLATKLQAILTPDDSWKHDSSIKFLIGCRSSTKFHNHILTIGTKFQSIDVGDFNDDDMAKTLSDDLNGVPGLTGAERKEASEAILTKAGPRFAYIRNIAVPFMREPFQRPLSRRLQSLPENMNNIYNDALHKMSSNYVELLRTALTMALLSPEPPKVNEVIDAYQRKCKYILGAQPCLLSNHDLRYHFAEYALLFIHQTDKYQITHVGRKSKLKPGDWTQIVVNTASAQSPI